MQLIQFEFIHAGGQVELTLCPCGAYFFIQFGISVYGIRIQKYQSKAAKVPTSMELTSG